MTGWEHVRSLGRLARRLPAFLREPVTPAAARAELERRLATRGERLVAAARLLIYENPASPYRQLLRWAGCEFGDFAAAVRTAGVEPTLAKLRAAGVGVSLAEFKGRAPICRRGLTVAAAAADFDNPICAGRGVAAATSGTRGARTRVAYDWELMAEHAVNELLLQDALGLGSRPFALWLPMPPSIAGLHNLMLSAKFRRPVAQWFSQTNPAWGRDRLAVRYVRACARWRGIRLPAPVFTPLPAAGAVARWLTDQRGRGVLRCYASAAVRVAQERELPGTVFLTGGEPLTDQRRQFIERSGATVFSRYSATETGLIGGSCAARETTDDMHVYVDRLAALTGAAGELLFTSLSPHTGKVLLNADIGDTGELTTRACGCGLGALGLNVHVCRVRSSAKFTGEGMMLLAADAAEIVSELVTQAGGGPEDFQLREVVDEGALPKLEITISSRVARLDEARFVEALLRQLARSSRGGSLAAQLWAQTGTVQIRRAEPQVTAAGKQPAVWRSDSECVRPNAR